MSERLERRLLVLLLAVAFATRLAGAVSKPLIFDEYRWLALADQVSLDPLRLPLHGDQHPAGEVYLAALGAALFGRNLLGYRISSVLLGTLLVFLSWRLGRRYFGPAAGLVAAALVASNPYLVGVSTLATEKSYLAFALAALLAFETALLRRTTAAFVAAGALFGAGVLVKETLLVWAPLLLLRMSLRTEERPLLRTPAPWWGVVAFAVVVAPEIVWNVQHPLPGPTPSDRGLAWQASRLGFAGWNWLATSLYARPLISNVEGAAVSEYPSHTLLLGGLLLLAALASLGTLRSTPARFLQLLGFFPFAVVTLLAGETDEYFWWADLSLVPFLLLTAAVVDRLGGARALAMALVLGLSFARGAATAARTDNCYPPRWTSPPERGLAVCRNSQRMLMVRARDRDHLALASVGRFSLPACSVYHTWQLDYRDYVTVVMRGAWPEGDTDPARGGDPTLEPGWPDPERFDWHEAWRWNVAELERFSVCPPGQDPTFDPRRGLP